MRWAIVAVVGLGVALVVAIAVVSLRGNDGAEPASGPTRARHTSPTAPRVDWVVEANAVCRLGRKLYPNIALGATGDPDTIHYAVNRLVNEIGAIAASPPGSGGHRLDLQGQAAIAAWYSLATRPETTVARAEKQEAARTAARYVDRLVVLGASACAALRPRTA
jgi:hypothetical protein